MLHNINKEQLLNTEVGEKMSNISNNRRVQYRTWYILGWSVVTAILLTLFFLPLNETFLSLDNGLALAQTIPPPTRSDSPLIPGDEPTPGEPTPGEPLTPGSSIIGGPGSPPGSYSCSAKCEFALPPGTETVNVEYESNPPDTVPPLVGEGIIVRVPAAKSIIPDPAGISVPSGSIDGPVGLISFDFGPIPFRKLGSLVVPTNPDRDLIVRIEILPTESAPVPLDSPGAIPTDWYVVPQSQFELGYGGSMAVQAPGVTDANYMRYAEAVGLPTDTIPSPDADKAGVIKIESLQGKPVSIELVFSITIYYADTGEEVTIHLPEMILVNCAEQSYGSDSSSDSGSLTPVVLRRSSDELDRYDIPVQAHSYSKESDLPERTITYILDTSTVFVVATFSGETRPPLLPGEPALAPNPDAAIPDNLSKEECSCSSSTPPGMQIVDTEYLSYTPDNIPALTGSGVIARIPAAKPVVPPLAVIPVPSGFISDPVGLVNFDFRPTFRAFCTLIVPTDPTRDLLVQIQSLSLDQIPIPIDSPDVIPRDWYAAPHPLVRELGYGAPIPIIAPGVTETNYEQYAKEVGLPTSPVPSPDAAEAGVLKTVPLAGKAINVESVVKIDLYYADTGERITMRIPEMILGDFCFEQNLSAYTPVLLQANSLTGKYDIPVQMSTRTLSGNVRERFTAYLLEPSATFVVATLSGKVRPPLADGQELLAAGGVPASVIPTGLPNTGSEEVDTSSSLWWVIIVVAIGIALAFTIRFSKFRLQS